jgi:hypothetical protein
LRAVFKQHDEAFVDEFLRCDTDPNALGGVCLTPRGLKPPNFSLKEVLSVKSPAEGIEGCAKKAFSASQASPEVSLSPVRDKAVPGFLG